VETQAPAQRGAGLAHRAAHRFNSKQRAGGAADPLEIDARPCEEWPRRRVDFRWRDRPGRDQTRRGEGKNAAPRWLSHRGPSDALPSASPSMNAARTLARWRRPYGRRLNRAPFPGPLGKRVPAPPDRNKQKRIPATGLALGVVHHVQLPNLPVPPP